MKICSVDQCTRKSRTNELCSMHYSRFRRTGKTEHSRPERNMTIEQRYWIKVAKTPTCWIWTGARQPSGHGVFRNASGGTTPAHVWLWNQTIGQVPKGMVLDHLQCDNPPCVNPAHLKVSTIGANVLRGSGESAKHSRKTHCIYGHPLYGENLDTIIRKTRGGRLERVCRTCARRRRAVADANRRQRAV